MLGIFRVFSFLQSLKLSCFLTTCQGASLFLILNFSAFLYISRTEFFKPLHIIFTIYIIVPETFIKIDLLQHQNERKRTQPMNRLKIHVITFTFLRYANFSKLMRTIHTSMASTFQFEYWHCFAFKRCNKLHNETYQSWRYARQNSECCNAVIHPKRLFFCYFFKKKIETFQIFCY